MSFDKKLQEQKNKEKASFKTYEDDDIITRGQKKAKKFFSDYIGVIVTIITIIVVFIISSTEGLSPVKASNRENAMLIQTWRESLNKEEGEFPEPYVSLVKYNNQEYYFVIDEIDENGNIVKWHFAHDGGLIFVFNDYKTWVLMGLTIVASLLVSYNIYTSTGRKEKEKERIQEAMEAFEKEKSKIDDYQQYVPDFVFDVNSKTLEMAKREILDKASIPYEDYINNKVDYKNLANWQKRLYKSVEKVEIDTLTTSDMLRGSESGFSKKIKMLPQSETEHKNKTMRRKIITQVVSVGLSSFVVSFGIIFGNILLGLTYATTIATSALTTLAVTKDYYHGAYVDRINAKTGYLKQFISVKNKYVEEEKKRLKKEEELALLAKKEEQSLEERSDINKNEQ